MNEHATEAIGSRCTRCGAKVEPTTPEMLTLAEIMTRYKVGRTKAVELRTELAELVPDAVFRNGRCVRVLASALDRLWERGVSSSLARR
jgi:hypothetical protein